jgi:hypothetical protein
MEGSMTTALIFIGAVILLNGVFVALAWCHRHREVEEIKHIPEL